MSTEIFANVARKDHLSLHAGGHPKHKDILELIHFKKDDVARATGVPVSSIRYDEKMPAELEERLNEWANLLNLVAQHFQGDARKTALWFAMANPMLGEVSPRDMIRFGRYKKLLKFILTALSENRP